MLGPFLLSKHFLSSSVYSALRQPNQSSSPISFEPDEALEAVQNASIDEGMYNGLLALYPSGYNPSLKVELADSGKLSCLAMLLDAIVAAGEKCVCVSNYTSTLSRIGQLCEERQWQCMRLDGKTPANSRMDLVNRFNSPTSTVSVFLLSAKAGGVGLNLIGASRLVLFDPDWNPATDKQAMARIWRDGQTRPVSIYRLLSTATVDEKIFCRQIRKQEVASSVVDETQVVRSFSKDNLKEVFTYRATSSGSETFDIITGKQVGKSKFANTTAQVAVVPVEGREGNTQIAGHEWNFVANVKNVQDQLLQKLPPAIVSYVFVKGSDTGLERESESLAQKNVEKEGDESFLEFDDMDEEEAEATQNSKRKKVFYFEELDEKDVLPYPPPYPPNAS